MLTVETRHAIDPATARGFDTDALIFVAHDQTPVD